MSIHSRFLTPMPSLYPNESSTENSARNKMNIFECPPEHQEGLGAVKQALGVHHHYLDNWIYHFFKNKAFNVHETILKLHRRADMEKTVFLNYKLTPFIRESMRSGAVQYIGSDKDGRPILYFKTVLNKADAMRRLEMQASLDMFLTWALRCSPLNPLSEVVWLINQKDASLMYNTDLIFQKDMAFRVSKFFPEMVAKLYVCNMNFALTFVVQPLVKHLPQALSNSIHIFSGKDIRNGKLLQYIDAEVLPVSLGGMNVCEGKENYDIFATTIEDFFERCIEALQQGISIKEMEMMEAYSVDKDGHPLIAKESEMLAQRQDGTLGLMPQRPQDESLGSAGARSTKDVGHEGLNDQFTITSQKLSPNCQHAPRVFLGGKCTQHAIFNEISSFLDSSSYDKPDLNVSSQSDSCDEEKNTLNNGSSSSPTIPYLSTDLSLRSCLLPLARHHAGANSSSMLLHMNSQTALDDDLLRGSTTSFIVPDIQRVDILSFHRRLPAMSLSLEELCRIEKEWATFRCYSIDLAPLLVQFIEDLWDGQVPADHLKRLDFSLLSRVAHYTLDLFPQTTQPLHFPLLLQFIRKFVNTQRFTRGSKPIQPLDCTSPENFLISVQASVCSLLHECEALIGADAIHQRVLRRLILSWPQGASQVDMLVELKRSARKRWVQLVPFFQKYIETKVSIAIGEFLSHYGLLIADGKVDPESQWYTALCSNLVQYHELHREHWFLCVFPPFFLDESRDSHGPTLAEILASHHQKASFRSIGRFILLVQKRFQAEMEVLSPTSLVSGALRVVVERYLEDTHEKIRIPYSAQDRGYAPQEFINLQQAKARELLEKTKRVLEQFLLISAGIFALEWMTERKKTSFPDNHFTTHEFDLREVTQLRKELTDCIASVKAARSVLMCLGQLAYEFQGTFSVSNLSAEEDLFDCAPNGYAFTYILLFVLACIQYNSQPFSPFTKLLTTSQDQLLTEDQECRAQTLNVPLSRAPVDIEKIVQLLNAMVMAGAPLVALRRRRLS